MEDPMSDRLLPGQALAPGQSIVSANGNYTFVLQDDGNVVLYRQDTGAALWASDTQGTSPETLAMQEDGNLVLYGYPPWTGGPGAREALWASGTDGNPGAWLVIQDDGNAVVYTQAAVWASDTQQGDWGSNPVPPDRPDRLLPNQILPSDGVLQSANNNYHFVMQTDGNVVLYRIDTATALWASNTNGTLPDKLAMQEDGNLVLYGYDTPAWATVPGIGEPKALWASGTDGKPGAWLAIQDDGNAVLYWPYHAIWASNTVQG
jgi:hypothetical protein